MRVEIHDRGMTVSDNLVLPEKERVMAEIKGNLERVASQYNFNNDSAEPEPWNLTGMPNETVRHLLRLHGLTPDDVSSVTDYTSELKVILKQRAEMITFTVEMSPEVADNGD